MEGNSMDDSANKKSDTMADEKREQKSRPISIPKVLQPTLSVISEPSKLKQWYLNYIMSDFTFASVSTAILAMIKIYFNLSWETFWEGLALWYLIYIATMVARIVKTVSEYYARK
jgi:predicted PurR-regulated permease PerM